MVINEQRAMIKDVAAKHVQWLLKQSWDHQLSALSCRGGGGVGTKT